MNGFVEVAMVFNNKGETLYIHQPVGRTGISLPDSQDLWAILWENKDQLGGVAHTHPWYGDPWPSATDLTTWDALERGLGKLLLWPVVTLNTVAVFQRQSLDEQFNLISIKTVPYPIDVENLRKLSRSSGSESE